MRKYRKLLISALLLVVIGVGAFLLYRHGQRPPEAARLLPPGDLLIYINFKPAHLWDLDKSRPVQLEGDYRGFVEQTGIQFERDLDEVAVSRQDTADGSDVESSEVFVGRFDHERLKNYLQRASSATETYSGQTIFSIPNEDQSVRHTVRVCILDSSRVAVTNMVSAEPIHGIIDRQRNSAAGSSLLESYYRNVPVASLVWLIDRIPANSRSPQLPGGLNFSFLENTVTVASLRYKGDVLFQADVIAPTEADAQQVMESAKTFLAMYRTVARSVGTKGMDADVKAALDSIRVNQEGNAAVFTATFSQRFLKKLVETPQEDVTVAPSPSPAAGQKR
jgi:hypothetical protein